MNHPTATLCADRENLAATKVTVHSAQHNVSGLIVAVRFGGGVTIQTHVDATPEDLASTLERLAADVRREARDFTRCEGSELPSAQPREREVRCSNCGRATWAVSAVCDRCTAELRQLDAERAAEEVA